MVSLEQKKQIVEDLIPKLQEASGVYLVDFERMDVPETNAFRSALREKGLHYQVVKNSLIAKAFEQIEGKEIPADKLKGQSGLVLAFEDPTVPSKIIKDSFKKIEKPSLKAALLDGQLFDGSELDKLAALPSKEDMIAAIMGSLLHQLLVLQVLLDL